MSDKVPPRGNANGKKQQRQQLQQRTQQWYQHQWQRQWQQQQQQRQRQAYPQHYAPSFTFRNMDAGRTNAPSHRTPPGRPTVPPPRWQSTAPRQSQPERRQQHQQKSKASPANSLGRNSQADIQKSKPVTTQPPSRWNRPNGNQTPENQKRKQVESGNNPKSKKVNHTSTTPHVVPSPSSATKFGASTQASSTPPVPMMATSGGIVPSNIKEEAPGDYVPPKVAYTVAYTNAGTGSPQEIICLEDSDDENEEINKKKDKKKEEARAPKKKIPTEHFGLTKPTSFNEPIILLSSSEEEESESDSDQPPPRGETPPPDMPMGAFAPFPSRRNRRLNRRNFSTFIPRTQVICLDLSSSSSEDEESIKGFRQQLHSKKRKRPTKNQRRAPVPKPMEIIELDDSEPEDRMNTTETDQMFIDEPSRSPSTTETKQKSIESVVFVPHAAKKSSASARIDTIPPSDKPSKTSSARAGKIDTGDMSIVQSKIEPKSAQKSSVVPHVKLPKDFLRLPSEVTAMLNRRRSSPATEMIQSADISNETEKADLQFNEKQYEWNNLAKRLWRQVQNSEEYKRDSVTRQQTRGLEDEYEETILARRLEIRDASFSGGDDSPIPKKASRSHDKEIMNEVPFLTSRKCHPISKLPYQEMTVFGNPDNIIYNFRVEAQPSKIPGAGLGLFLTFLGAKELKPSKEHRRKTVVASRRAWIEDWFQPAIACCPHDSGMKVTVTGKHLKAHYNARYLLKPLVAPKLSKSPSRRSSSFDTSDDDSSCASSSSNRQRRAMYVNLSNPDLAYDDDELAGLQDPDNHIGHLGLFNREDFVDAPRRTFSSLHKNCGFIHLGRYGPFQPPDRKVDLLFQVKTFLFGFEPGDWSFDVPAKLMGENMVIDITDDRTGEPHALARQHLPMYANEVGHNRNLTQTIQAFHDDNKLSYYIDVESPMKPGDTIELLTDYREGYEDSRERKGYGLKNLERGLESDNHVPTRLKRNLQERADLMEDLKEVTLKCFYLLVEFCAETADGLHLEASRFFESMKSSSGPPEISLATARQLIAIRRLDWLSHAMKLQVKRLRHEKIQSVASVAMLTHCEKQLLDMQFGRWQMTWDTLMGNACLKDKHGNKLEAELHLEALEEFCFSSGLDSPLDPTRWCPITIDLTNTLCLDAARRLWTNGKTDGLGERCIQVALNAFDELLRSNNLHRLSFESCKGQFDSFVTKVKATEKSTSSKRFVVTRPDKAPGAPDSITAAGNIRELQGVATPIESSTNQTSCNLTWYICCQIIYVINTLSKVWLKEESDIILDMLCSRLGVPRSIVDEALAAGKRPKKTAAATAKKPASKSKDPTRQKKQPKKTKTKNTDVKKRAKCNTHLFWGVVWTQLEKSCGWVLGKGNRPNDYYFLPPGVRRGAGFKNRVDFFDSVLLVLNCLRTHAHWSKDATAKMILKEYDECKSLYEKLRDTKKLPKMKSKEELVAWLREENKKVK